MYDSASSLSLTQSENEASLECTNRFKSLNEKSLRICEIVSSYACDLGKSYQTEGTYYEDFMKTFDSLLPLNLPARILQTIEKLTHAQVLVGCNDLSVDSLKQSVARYEKERSQLLYVLEHNQKLCKLFDGLVRQSEKTLSTLVAFSTEPHLSREFKSADVQLLNIIKKNFKNSTAEFTRLNQELQDYLKKCREIPEPRSLIAQKQHIDRLRERKVALEANLSRYQGLSSDTSVAKRQLEEARQKLASLDSYLVDAIGLNAWK